MLYSALKRSIRERARPEGQSEVIMPSAMFVALIRMVLANAPFDEEYYLRENPDVADSISQGKVESARKHFIMTGYFENRLPVEPIFDEDYYLRAYPDIAKAANEKALSSPLEHFLLTGRFEGRSPSSEFSLFKAAE
jgi:hypothetical protein